MKQTQSTHGSLSSTVLIGFILFAITIMIALLLPKYTPLKEISAWLATVNVIGFLTGGLDKRLAIKKRFRIPGKVILALAFAGGALGILLSLLSFRHKVKKGHFFIKIAAILFVQLIAVYFLWYFQVITIEQAMPWLISD
jgi:uncharacterized membrane protein YsdA (DUF1294 family)